MDHTSENLWIKNIKNPDKPLFSKATIENFNRTVSENIFSDKNSEPSHNFSRIIKRAGTFRAYAKKRILCEIEETITRSVKCDKFALSVKRASIRSLPTNANFHTEDIEIDRIQETGIEIGEPVRVILRSGKWLYAKVPFYAGWIRENSVAYGTKNQVEEFYLSKDFCVVTGNYVYTMPSSDKSISFKRFGMGAKIPAGEAEEVGGEIHTNQIIVKIPVRNKGNLLIKNAFLSENADISHGYLLPTRRNIVKEALKLLGEPYGWGDSFEARDCSGTIRSIYKTIGLELPRNASEQEKMKLGIKKDFSGLSTEEKLELLDEFQPGDLLFMQGHVMMYFGKIHGVHYIFHNFHRKYENGKTVAVNSALITPVQIRFARNKTAISEIRTGIIMEE